MSLAGYRSDNCHCSQQFLGRLVATRASLRFASKKRSEEAVEKPPRKFHLDRSAVAFARAPAGPGSATGGSASLTPSAAHKIRETGCSASGRPAFVPQFVVLVFRDLQGCQFPRLRRAQFERCDGFVIGRHCALAGLVMLVGPGDTCENGSSPTQKCKRICSMPATCLRGFSQTF